MDEHKKTGREYPLVLRNGELVIVRQNGRKIPARIVSINSGRGVVRAQLLDSDGKPRNPRAYVEAALSEISAFEEPSAAEPDRRRPEFEAGTAVRIMDGPFTGFDAVIEAVELKQRKLRLNVLVFGRPTKAELDFAQVEKVQ